MLGVGVRDMLMAIWNGSTHEARNRGLPLRALLLEELELA
jgi:hypothetical protein